MLPHGPNLRERFEVYQKYRQEFTPPIGRPPAEPPLVHRLTVKEAKRQAARLAGLRLSTTLLDQLLTVFKRGSLELQAQVEAGEVTITAAYNRIRKRKPPVGLDHSTVLTQVKYLDDGSWSVYRIVVGGKSYIGLTNDLRSRLGSHLRWLLAQAEPWTTEVLISGLDSENEAALFESMCIGHYDSLVPNGLNISKGKFPGWV